MTKRPEGLTSTILLIAVASIAFACPMLLAQTTPTPAAPSSPGTDAVPEPSFDVATIKPHRDGRGLQGPHPTLDGFVAASSLQGLVRSAYSHEFGDQVSGGPEWAKTDFYDVQAKMSEADIVEMQKLSPAEAGARRQQMVQALLAERFKLKVHVEAKQAPVYALVVAKGGPKMEAAVPDPSRKPRPVFEFRNGAHMARGLSMEVLAAFLSFPNFGVGRPVIDKTGLTGTYNFTFNASICSPPCGPEQGASISSALRELGLKLQPAIGPVQNIVIDHAERHTEN